ncbi:MAG: hypothetical protein M1114_01305 [Candidatus Dependentiae bacterium]|nr:hypothetical protein [Candidatus Dependentiae bacterium]
MKRINAIMLFSLLMAPLFNSAQNHDLTSQEYTRLIATLSRKDKAYVEEVLFRDYEKSYKERFLTQDTFVHTHFRKDIKKKSLKF